MDEGFIIFKQNRNILICLSFTDAWGSPLGIGWGTPMHVHMHANAYMHEHTHMLNMINTCHFQLANMFILAFHACAYMCMCTCLGTPLYAPRCLPPICSLSRAVGSPNHWQFISPELIEIILFCLKNLYLWTFLNSSWLTLITLDTHTPHLPCPWSQRSQNMMCRWGVSHPKWHFYVSSPKMYMFFTPVTP